MNIGKEQPVRYINHPEVPDSPADMPATPGPAEPVTAPIPRVDAPMEEPARSVLA